jgi:site-specific recombinase XerD
VADQVAEAWFTSHVTANLERTTQQQYAQIWDKHMQPRIGNLAVRDVTHPIVVGIVAELMAAGVGAQATRRAMSLGHQVFGYALASGYVSANPFVGVHKPSGKRARAVVPMTPRQVEAVRSWFLKRGKERDAVLVSLMAYAGLRPAEAYALTWDKVGERTLLIDCSAPDGRIKVTKTENHRSVTMLAPLATDLAEWQMRCGRPRRDQ